MHSVDNKNLNSPKNIPLSRSNAFTSISMHFSSRRKCGGVVIPSEKYIQILTGQAV